MIHKHNLLYLFNYAVIVHIWFIEHLLENILTKVLKSSRDDNLRTI